MYSIIGNDSGMLTTPAWPRRNPAFLNDSKSTVSSPIFPIGTMPPSGPPTWMALIFVLKPPASATTSASGVPIATS